MALRVRYSISLALLTIWLTLLSSSFKPYAQVPGTATYYTTYLPSACYGYEDQGVMIAAASEAIWNNGAACGQMYQVNCISGTNEGTPFPCWASGSVVVKIVDRCPASCRGTIDLSQEAFASIADPNSGVIHITYQQYVR
ncbi:EG45-like domain containing protein [Ricinus communis]|uniref:Expansin-like EG45 domain-containing protein n=1 Tax=Ricinus communis TaxID=3988 RepID=B9SXX5_RICCO|nr:EG45-like domain containing protein [Ricinus communis]EEF31528.1 conserved hypothetical protein [Ricinus communis]|eukprot:XP_002530854.1 EG45-like domain containing protein [Ricinus communis]